MAQSNLSAATNAAHIADVKEYFRRNGGKIFLVDDAKFQSVCSVIELIKGENRNSLLCITEDAVTAGEIAELLMADGIECRTVSDYEIFAGFLNVENAVDYRATSGRAGEFRSQYPNLIISLKDRKGKLLLHRAICANKSKSGVYFDVDDRQSSYCVSDFLADCRYEFTVIDSVHNLFAFQPHKEEEALSPVDYDRIEFLRKAYYTDTAHSYRRLKNIAGAAKNCVVLSDNIAEENAVELYAALNLLHDSFSFFKAKETVQKLASDYDESCELIYNDITNCKSDEGILSCCVQLAIGGKQIAPRDISSMDEFIGESLKYLSEEEIFLRAIDSYTKYRLGGSGESMERIVTHLESDEQEMAECFCSMFLRDTLKGELESVLSTPRISNMNEKEIAALVTVFKKYGVCRTYAANPGECSIIRLYRDNSGFEYCLNDKVTEPEGEECRYSVIETGEQNIYKCLAITNILNGKEKIKLGLPALVIVKDGAEEKVRLELGKQHGNVARPGEVSDGVSVMSFSDIRRTAMKPQIRSAIFYDFPADIALFSKIYNKVKAAGDVRVILCADYVDMGGHLLNAWKDALVTSPFGTIPFEFSEIEVKSGIVKNYPVVISRIDEVYTALRRSAEGYGQNEGKPFAAAFPKLLFDFTTQTSASTDEIAGDMRYFEMAAEYFDAILGNAMTVGRRGEQIEAYDYSEGSGKKQGESDRLIFNACAKMLLRHCDVLNNNCNGCADYKPLKRNDFKTFKAAVGKFFKSSSDFIEWQKEEKIKRMQMLKINSLDESDAESNTFQELIAECSKLADQAVRNVQRIVSQREGPVSVPYELVTQVLNAVARVYSQILDKYYARIEEVFQTATEAMRKKYKTVCNGLKSLGAAQ